jgi:hypothetical protein
VEDDETKSIHRKSADDRMAMNAPESSATVREPSELAGSAAGGGGSGAAACGMSEKREIKQLAKELDKSDKKAARAARTASAATTSTTSNPGAVAVKQPSAARSTRRPQSSTRKSLPEKFVRHTSNEQQSVPPPVEGNLSLTPTTDEDDCVEDEEIAGGPPPHNRSGYLIEATLVQSQKSLESTKHSNPILVQATPVPDHAHREEGDIAEEKSGIAKLIPNSTGGKLFCFGIMFLLVTGAIVVAFIVSSGNNNDGDNDDATSDTMNNDLPAESSSPALSAIAELFPFTQMTLSDLLERDVLDFSETNNYQGTIPTEIGNLTGLKELKLEENNLSGSLPTELGLMSSLEVLWIRNNGITGTIPR